MNTATVQFGTGRRLLIASHGTLSEAKKTLSRPFAALLPARDDEDLSVAREGVLALVALGCIEFCCVGPLAERVHDAIDVPIEDGQFLSVVTTWDVNEVEGCEYFLLFSGGAPKCLLALVADHPDLAARLSEVLHAERAD